MPLNINTSGSRNQIDLLVSGAKLWESVKRVSNLLIYHDFFWMDRKGLKLKSTLEAFQGLTIQIPQN